MSGLPVLDAQALRALAAEADAAPACPACAPVNRGAGWEAMPGTFDAGVLARVGTLRRAEIDDPTIAEWHPDGTHAWSADAPIAPAWFPYNRCDAWRCTHCGRAFLRYTEYGGYYQEERVRPLRAALVADAAAPG